MGKRVADMTLEERKRQNTNARKRRNAETPDQRGERLKKGAEYYAGNKSQFSAYYAENQQRISAYYAARNASPEGWSKAAVRHMRRRHKTVTVTWQDVLHCIEANASRGGCCPALPHMKLQYGGKFCDASATVDRINPTLGYVPGNIVILSKLANTVKSNATASEIRQVADFVARIARLSKTRIAELSEAA